MALLQTFSLISLPLAVILVLGGHFIIDSDSLSSAPYAGLFIFICGTLTLILSVFAFIGASFEYRRLLMIFSWASFAIALGLIGTSTACFAMGSQLEEYISNNWEQIRLVLPPTIEAKYDKTRFLTLVEVSYY